MTNSYDNPERDISYPRDLDAQQFNAPQPAAKDELTAVQRQKVEAAQLAFFELENERTKLRGLLDNTIIELRSVTAELASFKNGHAALLDEMKVYREQRDHAEQRRTELEVILDAVLSVLHRYQAPPAQVEHTK